jgi:hypothetical protein
VNRADPARFFRIIGGPQSTLDDYTSNAGFGFGSPSDPKKAALWDGISVFRTLDQARAKAKACPLLGSYVAELVIPSNAPVRWSRTIRRSRGHHTVWGDPAEIRRCEVNIHPV